MAMTENKIRFLKSCLPGILALVFVLFSVIPFSFDPATKVYIPLVLAVIYYFAIYRPEYMNVFVIFLLGLVADLLMQTPFGLNTFFFTFVFFISNLNRRFLLNLPFNGLWLAFVVLMGCVYIAWYFMASLLEWRFMGGWRFLSEYILLGVFAPVVMAFCAWVNVKLGYDA